MTIPDPNRIGELLLSLEVILCDDFVSVYRHMTWFNTQAIWPDIGPFGDDEKFKNRIRVLFRFLKSLDETICS